MEYLIIPFLIVFNLLSISMIFFLIYANQLKFYLIIQNLYNIALEPYYSSQISFLISIKHLILALSMETNLSLTPFIY